MAKPSDGAIRIKLKDEDLGVFDPMKLSMSDGYLIENESGLSIKQFLDGIGELRAVALQTLIWLMFRRMGKQVHRPSIEFDFGDLDFTAATENPTEESSGVDAVTP